MCVLDVCVEAQSRTFSCTKATMSGKEGIGFGPSFSEFLLGKTLRTFRASADTSSLLRSTQSNN